MEGGGERTRFEKGRKGRQKMSLRHALSMPQEGKKIPKEKEERNPLKGRTERGKNRKGIQLH